MQARDLALRIERELLVPGQPGAFLGGKHDLMARFGVGRPALEMAIRELESRDLAEMRRGPSGGLYRCEGGYMPAAISLATYITLEHVNHADVLDAHAILFVELVARAASCGEPGKTELRQLTDDYLRSPHTVPTLQRFQSSLWRCLTGMVGNPALSMALHSLEWIQRTIILNELPSMRDEARLVQMVKAWDRRVVRAIIEGRGEVAARLARHELAIIRRHIDAAIRQGELPIRARLRTPFKSNRGLSTGKLAMPTARALLNRVVDHALPPGTRLGTVESLATDLGVSVEVLRQSIRLIRQYGLVRLVSGRQGGVFVDRLSDAATMQSCARYYAQVGFTPEAAIATHRWLLGVAQDENIAPGVATILVTLGKSIAAHRASENHRSAGLLTKDFKVS